MATVAMRRARAIVSSLMEKAHTCFGRNCSGGFSVAAFAATEDLDESSCLKGSHRTTDGRILRPSLMAGLGGALSKNYQGVLTRKVSVWR